jgi:hypothetical protein
MKQAITIVPALLLTSGLLALAGASQRGEATKATAERPPYAGNQLVRPGNYRTWVYVSSGFGMNYNAATGGAPMFTNLFVPRWAYDRFLASGEWPEKTMFALEERGAENKGSIVKSGSYQGDLTALAVEVKDSQKFPADKWAYFGFGGNLKTASANPKADCWQCHHDHAAVEHSFVQFYPTLKPVAEKFGTHRKAAENVAR